MRINDKYTHKDVNRMKQSMAHIPEWFINEKTFEQSMEDSDHGNARTIRERDWQEQTDWLIKEWNLKQSLISIYDNNRSMR